MKQALQHRTAVAQATRVLQPFGPLIGSSDGTGGLFLRPCLPDSAGSDFAECRPWGEVVLSIASRAHLEVASRVLGLFYLSLTWERPALRWMRLSW